LQNGYRVHARSDVRFAMDLNLVKCLCTAVELGSMSRAAAELGISQPALTRQIKRLEHALGADLLIRNSRGVQLSDAGEFLLPRLEGLLARLDLITEEFSAWRGSMVGEVAVCLPVSLHRSVTSPLAEEISRTSPGLRLRVVDGFDGLLHDQLRDGLVDLGILVHCDDRLIEGVQQEALAREPLVLIGRADAFPSGTKVRIQDLKDTEMVLPGPRNQLRQRIEALFRRKNCTLKIGAETESVRLANDLVRRDGYFSILPASGVEIASESGIASWPIVGATINWALCIQKRREQSPAVQDVAKRLRRYVLQAPRVRVE
jgi:LysR family transcriptional regulator, nitrogen assimilation regulatory protein